MKILRDAEIESQKIIEKLISCDAYQNIQEIIH